jgi:hypothetical protein
MHYFVYFFRLHRASVSAFFISVLLLCAFVLVWINDSRMTRNRELQQQIPTQKIATVLRESDVLLQSLPTSSTDIADLLHRESERDQLPIDEISYESREEHDLPIVMRSASFTLTDSYATIRHYLDSVIHAQSNLTLDALDCTRDDISSRAVNCVITISAVQRRTPMLMENSHVR